ncbi:hypothetical protein J6590_073865 [Homalodisca vitripennis]|nr:hypothetical protein J6590_073865 [Homalodisca vitripennis]
MEGMTPLPSSPQLNTPDTIRACVWSKYRPYAVLLHTNPLISSHLTPTHNRPASQNLGLDMGSSNRTLPGGGGDGGDDESLFSQSPRATSVPVHARFMLTPPPRLCLYTKQDLLLGAKRKFRHTMNYTDCVEEGCSRQIRSPTWCETQNTSHYELYRLCRRRLFSSDQITYLKKAVLVRSDLLLGAKRKTRHTMNYTDCVEEGCSRQIRSPTWCETQNTSHYELYRLCRRRLFVRSDLLLGAKRKTRHTMNYTDCVEEGCSHQIRSPTWCETQNTSHYELYRLCRRRLFSSDQISYLVRNAKYVTL